MRTRTTKSSRFSRRSSKARRSTAEKIRRYLPLAAVICAGAYLPPKIIGANYTWAGGDVDLATWGTSANWTGGPAGGTPVLAGDSANFATNFTLNRTVTLNVASALSTIALADPKPLNTLTIQGDGGTHVFSLSTSGLTLNPAVNNTLAIASPTGTSSAMLVDATTGGKLIKNGLGTVILTSDNTYTGSTTLNAGIVQVSKVTDGGLASPLGAATKDPNNLLFNGGTLRYTGAAVSTNRSFTVLDDVLDANGNLTHAAATIDSSGTGVLTLTDSAGVGVIKGSFNPQTQSTLVLRGTTGGTTSANAANQIDFAIHDGDAGGPLSLLKTDTGVWRLTSVSNTYSGDTIVQRGALSLDYRNTAGSGIIPSQSRVVVGGLPGGGLIDLITTTVNGVGTLQQTGGFVIKPGANAIQGTSGGGTNAATTNGGQFFSIPNLNLFKQDPDDQAYDKSIPYFRTPGGTLRMNNTALIQTDSGVPFDVKNFGGWLTINDDWVTVQPASSGRFNTAAFATVFTGSNGYTTANGGTGLPDNWSHEMNIDITGHLDLPLDNTQNGGVSKDIWSLRFSGGPTPSKNLILADHGVQPSVLNIAGGGLMQQSNSGNSHIIGGVVTSAEGELFINVRANSLLFESAIEDFVDLQGGGIVTPVGFTKWGGSTLILQPKKQVFATEGPLAGQYVPPPPSSFTGNVYVNEGTLVVRQDDGLGSPIAASANDNRNISPGKTRVNGGVLDFQGVQYKRVDPYPNPQTVDQEVVEVYSGSVASTQGRSGFAGSLVSKNPDAQMTINVNGNALFEVGLTNVDPNNPTAVIGDISGVTGPIKTGTGTLVVNGKITVTPNLDPQTGQVYLGVGDLSLTAGNSILNGSINLGTPGSLNATGGNNSINGTLAAARVNVSGTTFLAMNTPGATFGSDFTLSGGTTLLASPAQSAAQSQTYSGNLIINGGTVVVNNSATFSGTFLYTSGGFSELGNVVPGTGNIPTVRFSNGTAGSVVFGNPAAVSGSGQTVTLQGNTIFTSAPVINPFSTLTLTGLGATTFSAGINVTSSGTFNLVNAVLNGSFTVNNGTQSFNGLNAVTGTLTINAGTFQQAGTRRGIVGGTLIGGIYGVRDRFGSGVFNGTTSPSAIVVNNTVAATALSPNFGGANEVIGNILVQGTSPGFAGFTQTTEIQLSNNQTIAGGSLNGFNTGNLKLQGGRAIIQSAQALGDGVAASSTGQYSLSQGGGVTITGEKSVLLLQRGTAVTGTVTNSGGVATAANNEDVVIGPTTGYVTGVVITNRGTGYTGPTVTFGAPPAGGVTATGTVNLSGTAPNSVSSVSMTSVGGGYITAPVPTFGGTAGSGATGISVLGGPVFRTNDQHNVWGGNLVLDNVSTATSGTGTAGTVVAAIPILSVNSDDSLAIEGNIFGSSALVTAGTPSRLLATALPASPYNSSTGFIILDGHVQDNATGIATNVQDRLRTDWGGNNELQVLVNNNWKANGMITLSQGTMRFTQSNTTNQNFFDATVTAPSFELSVAAGNTSSVGWNAGNVPINFFLTKAGQVFNAPSFTVHDGNTDKLGLSGNSTGNITIGGENTSGVVTYGTGNGNITLETDAAAQIRDLRLYAAPGGTVEIKAALAQSTSTAGSGSITKIGDGTVRLLGSSGTQPTNLVSRAYLVGGTLDLAGFDTTATNNARLATTVQTFFSGGNLRVDGNGNGPANTTNNVVQQFNGQVNILKGGSAISAVENWNGSGGSSPTTSIVLGSGTGIRRDVGGTMRFTEGKANGAAETNASLANIIFGTNNAVLANGTTLGTISTTTPLGFSTYGTDPNPTSANAALYFTLKNLTAVDPYNPSGYSTTGSDNVAAWAAGAQVSEATNSSTGFTGTVPASLGIGSIRFGATNVTTANGGTVNIDPAALLTVTDGILLASNAGGANRAINGGKITAGTKVGGVDGWSGDLIIHNYGGDGTTGPSLTIGSQITGTKALTVAGDGTTILTSSANDFNGSIFVNGGVLSVNNNGQLGNAGNQIFLEGGTIAFTDDLTLSRSITAYGDRSTVSVAGGKTLTINSASVQLKSDTTLIGSAYGGLNLYAGDLALSGGGTIRQVVDGAVNPFYGQLIVTGGTKYISETNGAGFFGNNVSYSTLDGTVVEAGSTVELRSTNTATYNLNEFFTLAGSGQLSQGAIHLSRATVGPTVITDREIGLVGPVNLSANATINVDDAPEVIGTSITATTPGFVGILDLNDNIVDGGATATNPGYALTKTGAGILRFVNNRTQNLPTINVNGGEVRFESGITGVIGASAGFFTPLSQLSNFFSGTSTINVGGTVATPLTTQFTSNPRLWFNDARGVHTADINLSGGFMLVNSPDAPLQSVNFGGTVTVSGGAGSVTWDSVNGRLINNSPNALEVETTGSRANPTVMFGPLAGSGSLVKFGRNELQLVNNNNTFSGDLVLSRGGFSSSSTTGGVVIGSPSLGLYDGGQLKNVHAIYLTNDASMHLDNQNSLDATTANDQASDNGATTFGRINNSAELHLSGDTRVRLIGNLGATPTTETVGALFAHSGAGAIELDPGVNGTNYRGIGMNFSTYSRDTGSIMQFRVLGKNMSFVAPASLGDNKASITINNVPSQFLSGTGTGTSTAAVILGAFGGAATSAFSSLPGNTTVPVGLNNNEQLYVARNFMTWDSTSKLVRPLVDAEKFIPTKSGITAQTVYVFPSNTAANQNLELRGGFGPFSSAVTESLTADEGLFVLPGSDSSRKEDTAYVLQNNLAVNTLRFAPQSTEYISGAGNRILLELKNGVTMSLKSGMILNGAFGTLQDNDSNTGDVTDQRMYIRGGKIDAGTNEIIIHNTAASFRENSGTWANSNADLSIFSSLAGSAGLTKSGLGTVQLGGDSTYSGTTTVSEGVLRLVSDHALGNSTLAIITGLGDLRVQRGVTIGSAAKPVTVRMTNVATTNQLVSDANYNIWYGDIQIDNATSAGERAFNANIQQNNAAGAFVLNGNIYGLDAANGGTTPLNDIQRGRTNRQLTLTQVGGVMTLNGTVRDTPTGPISTRVDSSNEDQTLHTYFQGNNNESFYYLNRAWDSAGALNFRRGNIQLEPAAGSTFFTTEASARINPYFNQSRTTMTDTDTGSSGDVSITLTTAGQVFNTPQMNFGTSDSDATKTLVGANTTGHTLWLTTGVNDPLFDATQRTSAWDSIVRLYSKDQGVMDIYGRITDTAGQNSGIEKIGSGLASMHGMPLGTSGYATATSALNDIKKQIIAAGGTLELDYETNNLGAVANAWGTSAVIPVLAGGTLKLKGDTENVTNQTWGGLTTRSGGSELAIGSGTGALGLNLTIGGNLLQLPASTTGTSTAPTSVLNHSGATVNFVNLNPTGTNAAKLTLTAVGSTSVGTGSTGGLITALPIAGAQPVVMASWATYGNVLGQATDWAARNNAGVVTAFSNYAAKNDPIQWAPGDHINETTGFTGGLAVSGVKTIRFGAPTVQSTLNLPNGFKLGNATATDIAANGMVVADEGGILVPSGTTAAKKIAGGTLQVNSVTNNDLYIHNYGTGGLEIASEVTGAQNVVFTGTGVTTLSAARNTYQGTTYISNGTLSVSSIAGNTSGTTPTGVGLTVVMKPHLDQLGNPVAGQFDPSNAATVTSATGFFVGQLLSNTTLNGSPGAKLFPDGTVVTGISGTTIEFSQNANGTTQGSGTGPSGTGSVGNQLGNSVGSSTSGIVLNGGTLRYTQSTANFALTNAYSPTLITAGSITVPTARPVTLGGTGGTFQIDDPGVNLQLDGVVTSVQSAALQATGTSYQTRNNYVGDLIKTGSGTLTLNNANTYTGLTEVKAGTPAGPGVPVAIPGGTLATISNSSAVFGTSYGELDGTIVRGSSDPKLAATLRLSPSGAVSIPEWITMENNTTLDVKYASAGQQVVTLDGVLTLGSRIDPGYPAPARDVVNITYNGDLVKTGVGAAATFAAAANAGNAVLSLNNAGGYLRGSAIIQKGTVWGAVNNTSTQNRPDFITGVTSGTSVGGVLVFNESSPEFTGTLHVDGGRVVLKSLGLPLGTGVLPVMVGTLGSNYFDTSAIPSAANPTGTGTLATANVFPEANLFFQPENAVSVNGGASSVGSLDTVPGQYRILQDIIINKPHAVVDAQNNTIPAGSQVKQIGVTTTTIVGPGLGNNMPVNQDSFNFDGRIIVDDDFNLYLDDNATLNPAGGAQVNLNLNNKLITGQPNANPLAVGVPQNNGYQTPYLGNITTKVLQNGRAAGAEMGIYNDLFFNINVNGDNSEFRGAWTIGNTTTPHNGSFTAPDVAISNPDVNHVVIVGNDLAFNGSNQIKMQDEATFRVNGHNTTIGSLVTDTLGGLDPIQFNPPGNPFGSNPNYSPNPVNSLGQPLTINNFTTADIPRNIHDYTDNSFQNFPMIRAIVENANAAPGNLTINQTANSYWNVFIRDGVTSTGAAAGALTITKTGNGIAQIEQANIYTGGTVINGGYLQVENIDETTSATGPGTVTINHGGGVSGDGYIAGHVHVSGSIRPGEVDLLTGSDSSGLLTFQGGTEFHTGTTLDFELRGDGSESSGSGSGRDQLATPLLKIDGEVSLQLKINPGEFSPIFLDPATDPNLVGGSHYKIIDTDAPIQLLPGSGFDFYGVPVAIGGDVVYNFGNGSQQIFRLITENGGSDLTLVAVPEPGTATTLVSGAALLLGLQRFRRRTRHSAA